MMKLPILLADFADVFVLHFPGQHSPKLKTSSIRTFADAIAEVIESALRSRPLVLAGIKTGALVALAVRSSAIGHLVVVEPPIFTAKAWRHMPDLRDFYRANPQHRPLIEELYGRSATLARNHSQSLNGLEVPTDVLVGGVLEAVPGRSDFLPSFVDMAARKLLAEQAYIRLHVAPNSGHSTAHSAYDLLREKLLYAVKAVTSVTQGFNTSLLVRATLTASSVAYIGPFHEQFASAYLLRNPTARVEAAGQVNELGEAIFDLIVLGSPDVSPAWLLTHLTDGGEVVVAEGVADHLFGANSPFFLIRRYVHSSLNETRTETRTETGTDIGTFDDISTTDHSLRHGDAILVAGRRGLNPPAPTHLVLVAFVPELMAIRTRLPAQGLRAEAELCIRYMMSGDIPEPKRPTLTIVQRPGLDDLQIWQSWALKASRLKSPLVLEIDDHPDLIDLSVENPDYSDWRVFSCAHAIQTSTPELGAFFSQFNDEVRVFRNAVFELHPFPGQRLKPRIFYGATPRFGFPVEVVRTLESVLARHPDCECVIVGDREVFDAMPTTNKQFHDYMAYDAYLALMGTCSILLTPLLADVHKGKSDAKWLDAASRGVLTIASPTAYGTVISHGETGLIAQGLEDWPVLLAGALADREAGTTMARRAWEHVRDHRMFSHQVAARRDWYLSLMDRREALDASLIARLNRLDYMTQLISRATRRSFDVYEGAALSKIPSKLDLDRTKATVIVLRP